MKKRKAKKLSPEEGVKWLKGILQPVSREIEALRAANGIVFVVHKPSKLWREAMRKIGWGDVDPRGTTVFTMSCADAVRSGHHDPLTRRWLSASPLEGETKIFLCGPGDGSLLVTLQVQDDGSIAVEWERDLYPVR